MALRDLSQREAWPYQPQVIAITGTNGKTTVTALTGLLLQRAGVRSAVAGNIGPALLDVLAQALDSEAVAEREDQRLAMEQAQAAPMVETAQPAAADAAPQPSGEASDAAQDQDEAAPVADPLASEVSEDGEAPLRVPPPAKPPLPPHLPAVWVLELSSFQLDGVAGGAWDAVIFTHLFM